MSDWFRFTLTSKRRVVITAGDLPVNAKLDLYSSCSTRLTGADESGNRYEEITRTLSAGTYRVKVSFPSGSWSGTPYALNFRPMSSGMPVKTSRITSGAGGGGPIRIVGEVLNNTGANRGRATITATFKSSSGKTVATLQRPRLRPSPGRRRGHAVRHRGQRAGVLVDQLVRDDRWPSRPIAPCPRGRSRGP